MKEREKEKEVQFIDTLEIVLIKSIHGLLHLYLSDICTISKNIKHWLHVL